MIRYSIFLLFILAFLSGCTQPSVSDGSLLMGKGALMTTRFQSFEEFKEVVQIEYTTGKKPAVKLTHTSNGQTVISVLEAGISEADIMEVRKGSFWDKLGLCFRSPFFVINRQDVLRVFVLGRRRHILFGWKDVAFYDLAENMMHRVTDVGLFPQDSIHFSEKGYINTFNHITSQAFMTTLFSEHLADFIADTHERSTLPSLITGDFTEKEVKDVEFGAVDNYVDFINNEWGQELGKLLKRKYDINRHTHWSPELLADYLNDIQNYFSEALQIGFQPFSPEDEVVTKFSYKLNVVMNDLSSLDVI